MIEIKKLKGAESGKDVVLIIDGSPVESGHAFDFWHKDSNEIRVVASLYRSEDSERLAAHLFTDLPSELEEVNLRLDLDWPDRVNEVEIRRLDDDGRSFGIGSSLNLSTKIGKDHIVLLNTPRPSNKPYRKRTAKISHGDRTMARVWQMGFG
jgi:hypothetical protein